MCRKLLIAGAILLVAAIAVKKMHLGGYVCSALNNIHRECRNSIPEKVEFERIEYEISQMDRDIRRLARPLAELKFDIDQHKKEIVSIKDYLSTGKKNLNTWITEIDGGSPAIIWNGREYSRTRMKEKVALNFATFKRYEAQLQTKEQLVVAKQKRFDAIYDQAEKLAAKKREFQVRLENLRAERERLEVQKIENRPIRRSGRVKVIDEAMNRIEKNIQTERNMGDILKANPFVTDDERPNRPTAPEPDLDEIRTYLNGDNAVRTEVRK